MESFIKGDIVVLPFPFSDLSANKRRPALVLVNLDGDDIILCQITSKGVKDNIAITINNDDIENGSLKEMSNIRPNKLFTADKNIILYKLGNLTPEKVDNVVDEVVAIFKK